MKVKMLLSNLFGKLLYIPLKANVFILCFNLVDPNSFQNVREKWINELNEYAPNVPIILVGLKVESLF